MSKKPVHIAIGIIWLVALSCTIPGTTIVVTPTPDENEGLILTITALAGGQQAVTPSGTFTLVPTLPGTTATITPSLTTCPPTITANSVVNVRSGPGTVYDPPIGSLPAGATAAVDGKNADSSWWYIVFAGGTGGHGWVSASLVTANCIPATLAVVAAPPTPLPASGTCKDSYVWRLIRPSDKVCVTPASKAQADADNAADAARKVVYYYGADACIPGYVWRDAYSGDVVCVTTAAHDQAQADNAAAASRWVSGPYGSHTCISGFIWRNARPGDDVCVTSAVYDQTQADNAAAASRKAGPYTCISGYIWREAFAGDYVCVTPAVRTQVAADNAAAPSHTWP